MYELTTLGSLDLVGADRGSVRTLLAQPKRLALLIFLVVEAPGSFVRRDTLLALFWPEADESRARGSLRQALQFLRRALGDESVRARGEDEVGIDAARVRCDAVAFRAERDAGRFERALRTYGGDFLAGFLVDDAPAFERWVATQRHALHRDAVMLAGRLADDLASRDPAGAIVLARRAVALSPLDEGAAQRLARLLDAAGDRAGALVAIEELGARLQRELGVPPSPETAALASEVRSRRAPAETVRGTGEGAAPMPTGEGAESVPAGDATSSTSAARSRSLIVGASLALAAALILALALRPRAEALPEPSVPTLPRVVVAPFANQTGDSAFAPLGGMVADWITEGLSRVDGLTVVPLTAVTTSVRALGTGVHADTTFAGLARVAGDVGATVLVRGAAYRTGATLHLQAQVSDARTGALLRPAETVSVPIDSVMAGIDRLRTRVVAGLAPLADTVSHLRRAVAPPSYEAYRDYVMGLERFVTGDPREALALFERSAAADTVYPMPRIAASIMLMNLGEADSAATLAAGVAREREKLGPLERATHDMVQAMLAGDLAAVDRAAREQARIAPGSISEYMVGETARRRGRPHEAIAVLRALGPDRGELRGWRAYWRELTAALHMIGDHQGEVAAAREAVQRYPRDLDMLAYLVRALAALGERASIDSVLSVRAAMRSDRFPDEGSLAFVAANGLEARGDVQGSGALRARELTWLEGRVGAQRSTSVRWRHARALMLAGRLAAARDTVRLLEREAPSAVAILGLAGAAAARDGDLATVARVIARLEEVDRRRSAPVRALSEGDVPYWLAAMAAQRGNPGDAVAQLRSAYASGRGRDPALASDPLFAAIREDAAFRRLARYAESR